MAERRMLSKRIVETARFLRMPMTAQCLYMHLVLNADDDGICEAYIVIRMAGCSEEDLNILVEKNFVRILNDDLVVHILDWDESNKVRADRKTPSIYAHLLKTEEDEEAYKHSNINSAVNCQPTANQVTAECQPTANQVTAECQPTANQVTAECPHRIGEDRIGEDRGIAAAARARTREAQPVDNFARVVERFENDIHPLPNQTESDDLHDLCGEYGAEWCIEAIKEAGRSRATSIRYIAAILSRWKQTGQREPWKWKKRHLQQESRGKQRLDSALQILEELNEHEQRSPDTEGTGDVPGSVPTQPDGA